MVHHRISVGRRKTAVARVILKPGSGEIKINDIALEKYFPIETLKTDVLLPFTVTELLGKYDVDAIVNGGGSSGQAGAVKLGISRALVDLNNDLRGKLREHDLLTRDSRMVERKKYGQRKARKRFQFSKR
ncbi:MAG: 30S ribosomal protein S9 [Chlorobiaceae bacterium]|nr:30S ribosomal protein S9 [Chlorobiaceae bacterium]